MKHRNESKFPSQKRLYKKRGSMPSRTDAVSRVERKLYAEVPEPEAAVQEKRSMPSRTDAVSY